MKNITGFHPGNLGFVLRRDKGQPLTHEEMDDRFAGLMDFLVFLAQKDPELGLIYIGTQSAVFANADGTAVEAPISDAGYFGIEVDSATVEGKTVVCEGHQLGGGVVINTHGKIVEENFVSGESQLTTAMNAKFVLFPAMGPGFGDSVQVHLAQPENL